VQILRICAGASRANCTSVFQRCKLIREHAYFEMQPGTFKPVCWRFCRVPGWQHVSTGSSAVQLLFGQQLLTFSTDRTLPTV
jgi:hypothetical protein